MTQFADQYEIHESATDRARQTAILREYCREKEMTHTQTPKGALLPYDAKLFRPCNHLHVEFVACYGCKRVLAIAEAKWRDHEFGHFGRHGYTIDARKIDDCRDVAKKLAAEFVLIVEFTDGIWYATIDQPSSAFEIHEQAHGSRDEFADIVCVIPYDLFAVLKQRLFVIQDRDGDYIASVTGTEWDTVPIVFGWTRDKALAARFTDIQLNGKHDYVTLMQRVIRGHPGSRRIAV